MKRFLSSVSATALVGACVLSSQSVSQAASTPPTTPHEVYLVGLLTPMHGSLVGGAVALIGGSTTQTANGNQNVPGNGQQSQANSKAAVAQTLVGLQVSGLRPTTSYTLAIAPHACGAGSSSSSTFTSTRTLLSNVGGDAAAISTQKFQVAPKQTMQVALLDGTGTSAAVACATLHVPQYIVTIKPMAGSTAGGVALITSNVPVLNGMNKTGTEVIVYATGLQKNTVQPNHIHAGPCKTTSSVLFPLSTLVTDKTGSALAGTDIPTSVNLSTGSIHIHRTNFAPEACGDLAAKTAG